MKNYEWNGAQITEAMKRGIERGLEAVGVFVEGAAVDLCPVGKYPAGSGRVGGRLKGSISHQTNFQEASVKVGTNVEYAPYVEFGTSRQKAQPYLRPAIDANEKKINDIFIKNFRAELK